MAANERLVERVREVAQRLGATPAQVALAWVLAQGEHVLPIPGTRRQARLEETPRPRTSCSMRRPGPRSTPCRPRRRRTRY